MAEGNDIWEMRRWLHSHVEVPPAGRVLDLGCGNGDDLRALAHRETGNGWYFGIDLNPDAKRPRLDPIHLVRGSIEGPLPFAPESMDVLYSVNALECLTHPPGALARWADLLRPGGQIVVAHFDWDTQTFDGVDRNLVRRLVQGYADWQQAWMPAIDPWAGRRLWRWAQASGRFEGEVRCYTLTNNTYAEPLYGWRQVKAFSALARRQIVSQEEYFKFVTDIERLVANNQYFYSVTMYAFVGYRRL